MKLPELLIRSDGTRTLYFPSRIDLQEGLLADHRRLGDLGKCRLGPIALRRVYIADEDHVPVRSGPTAPFGVPGDPLLLRPGVHLAVDQRRRTSSRRWRSRCSGGARYRPGCACGGTVRRLRDGPLHRRRSMASPRSPRRTSRRSPGPGCRARASGMHVARDADVVGRRAQAQDLRVVPDRHVHFVFARQRTAKRCARSRIDYSAWTP
jgi:hypothetical protein